MMFHDLHASNHAIVARLVVITVCFNAFSADVPPFLWHHDMDFTHMVQGSSLIVIAAVQSVSYVGPILHATDDEATTGDWQLLEVDANVEDVLKGRFNGPSLRFYFYTWLGGRLGDWNSVSAGDRCVFFLKKQGDKLRAVRDYWRSSIEVGSGRHNTSSSIGHSSVRERIAVLLLTPGEDLNPNAFASTLVRAVGIARDWLGPCRTVSLLRPLTTDPHATLRQAAIEQMRLEFRNERCP